MNKLKRRNFLIELAGLFLTPTILLLLHEHEKNAQVPNAKADSLGVHRIMVIMDSNKRFDTVNMQKHLKPR
jgi:hypothetical protein